MDADEQTKQKTPPLDLSQAIFAPFAGFDAGPRPAAALDREQRARQSVAHVAAQQGVVRRNMLSLALDWADRLVVKANSELRDAAAAAADDGQDDDERERDRAQRRREEATLLENLRAQAPEGATWTDYQIRAGGQRSETSSVASLSDGAGGEMGGRGASRTPSSSAESRPRTPLAIRKDATMAMQFIVNEATAQLEACDRVSAGTPGPYQQRRSGGASPRASPASPPAGAARNKNSVRFADVERPRPAFTAPRSARGAPLPPGILKRRPGDSPQSPAEIHSLLRRARSDSPASAREPADQNRRMSNGMPVAGTANASEEPARIVESIESLRR